MKNAILVFCLTTLMSGCYYDNVDEMYPAIAPCDTSGTISFSSDILPVMLHSCGSQDLACHSTDGSQSGYGLGTYNDIIFTIDDSGDFLETITHSNAINSSKWMPKNSNSKIDNCSIELIEAWLNRGRLNN